MKSRGSLLALSVLLFVTFSLLPATADARTGPWEPRHTWVFMVGLVEWQDKTSFDSFPADNRKDTALLDTFKKRGIPTSQIVYLQDRQATTDVVQAKFNDFLQRPAPGDWVLVYFEGHGFRTDNDEKILATYDATEQGLGWNFRSVPDAIEKNFRGDHAVIMLDNCYSGAMADAVTATQRRVSYAVLASSMAAQESTGNWTYTEAMINGFSGEPFADLNHDGRVTLRELAKNAETDMLFGEQQVATTAVTGGFDPETVIAITKAAVSPRIGERVEAHSAGEWWRAYIVAEKGPRVLVHYYGYEQSQDRWILTKNIRVPLYDSPFHPGEKVEVAYKHDWYPAHILNIRGQSHYVTYDDYDTDENEWVPTTRIRKLSE